jgi:curli biogenesis system outer membrane secretion channel CsgG
MKKSFLVALVGILTGLSTQALAKIPVSVTAFTNEAAYVNNPEAGCYHYNFFDQRRIGTALQERLVAELVRDKRLMVLERKNIKDVYYGELQLINSHKTKQIEKGKFQQAKYTLVGVVKSFEWCTGGTGASLNVGRLVGIGDLSVGGKKNTATIEVEIRLIDTRTGEVIASESGSSDRSSVELGLKGNIRSVDFGGSQFKNSLLGKAIDEAIHDAASDILGEIPDQA